MSPRGRQSPALIALTPCPLSRARRGRFLLQFGGFGFAETAKLPIIPPPLVGVRAGGGVIWATLTSPLDVA